MNRGPGHLLVIVLSMLLAACGDAPPATLTRTHAAPTSTLAYAGSSPTVVLLAGTAAPTAARQGLTPPGATVAGGAPAATATLDRLAMRLTEIALLPTSTPAPAAALAGMFDVGGHKLYLECWGEGSPTVVMMAGNGQSIADWKGLPFWIRDAARVCVYDRAGMGSSEPGPRPTSSLQMARELHTLLDVARVPGPYVLVAFSLGGLVAPLYAHEYPQEVVGMVLIDSAHPNQRERLLSLLPTETPHEPEALKAHREALRAAVWEPEGFDWEQSRLQLEAVTALGNLPLVVLTRAPSATEDAPRDLAPELVRRINQEWQKMQQELLRLSANSKQIVAEKAGHAIWYTEKDLAVDAIKRMVEEAGGN